MAAKQTQEQLKNGNVMYPIAAAPLSVTRQAEQAGVDMATAKYASNCTGCVAWFIVRDAAGKEWNNFNTSGMYVG